ncbi:MAG: PD40 domain-containing protein [Thermoguttaceae bacterium]|nr:PD40 domain-containing protein [Thermoguttaceae bacterium]
MTSKTRTFAIALLLAALLPWALAGCSRAPAVPETAEPLNEPLSITPDYAGCLFPVNIAPPSFRINNAAEQYITVIAAANQPTDPPQERIVLAGRDAAPPIGPWKRLCEKCAGGALSVTVYLRAGETWRRAEEIPLHISPDKIDPYLTYRLIEPGYDHFGTMRLAQRHLETYDEKPFFDANAAEGTCANCHAAQNRDPRNMIFHTRGNHGGTILVRNGRAEKIGTKSPDTALQAVYPSWHPTCDLIAFSTNKTFQIFHASGRDKIEVMDAVSDLLLYDVKENRFTQVTDTPKLLETFPSWSPDGKTLYYCAADISALPLDKEKSEPLWSNCYGSVRYALYRRGFSPETRAFTEPEPVWDAPAEGKSVVHPRVSPDGRFLVAAVSDDGTFPIWHPESDLYLIDLATGDRRAMTEINSDQSESYHSWDSSGRWLIFVSRRDDTLYTRIYIAHIDQNGNGSKPFLLPQRRTTDDTRRMKSYNLPEPMVEPIPVSLGTFMRVITLKSPRRAAYQKPSGSNQ